MNRIYRTWNQSPFFIHSPAFLGFLRFLRFFAAIFFISFCGRASAQDWPCFLGPNGNGISSETNLIDHWPTNGPTLVWDVPVGAGYGAPSVRGNHLVLHHRIGDEEIVESFAVDTGRSLWRFAYPTHFIDPYGYNNGPRATPLLSSNRCYTFGAEGILTCLDLATGKLIWQDDTSTNFNIPPAFFGVGSSPILENGWLIVMVGGQPDSGVAAFDPQTGKTIWENVGLGRRADDRPARRANRPLENYGQAGELFHAVGRDDSPTAAGAVPDAPGTGFA
jgi:hypothetical protein